VTREFLCNIENTLDPSFFRKAIDEVETMRARKYQQDPHKIQISQEMLELLSTMTVLNIKGGVDSKRSLNTMKFGTRKRKRHTMKREIQLSTALNPTTVAAQSEAYV